MQYVMLKNPNTLEIKKVTTGFSWVALFFGILLPLCRMDFAGIIFCLIYTGLMFVSPALIFASALLHFAFAMLYNDFYVNRLVNQGWIKFTHGGE